MAYSVAVNPFTGQLQLVTRASSGSGNVTGIAPTVVNNIATWANTSATEIQNSLASVQAAGDIHAQIFVTNRQVSGTVIINGNESAIAPGLQLQPGSIIILEPGAELIVI